MRVDSWKRDGGGGGTSHILEHGDTFEKAGINHSLVFGTISDQETPMFQQLFKQQGLDATIKPQSFLATGISLVMHPKNPYVPTVHANFRYFECQTNQEPVWWFGGGCDLTPYYLFEEDVSAFHNHWKKTCETFNPGSHKHYKQKCDDYFYLPHRGEHRGVGGIFFDYENQESPDSYLNFIEACGNTFSKAYWPIVKRHKETPYSERERNWQLARRGRYVEFNLLYDRGTLFGLKTHGRIESILMSLPPSVSYPYQLKVEPGSEEEKLLNYLKKKES